MRRLFTTAVVSALAALSSTACGGPDSRTSYIPDAPYAYDGRYLAGSFEQPLGNSWDLCPTRTPGRLIPVIDVSAASGSYLSFEAGGCSGSCQPTNLTDSQVDLWLIAAPSASDAMGLYLDLVNEGGGAAPGNLRFYGTGSVCAQETLLADIPFDRLELGDAWSTRCVTVSGLAAYHGIGFAATGGMQTFGVDALRLGPPCHGSR